MREYLKSHNPLSKRAEWAYTKPRGGDVNKRAVTAHFYSLL